MKKLFLFLILTFILSGCTVEEIKNVTKEAASKTADKGQQIIEKVQKDAEIIAPVAEKTINETAIIARTVTQELVTNKTNVTLGKYDAIIAFGDSLTYGEGVEDKTKIWPYLFANGTKLYNYAISGATTYSVKTFQLQEYLKEDIKGNKLIFVWIGANDAANFYLLGDFEQNYRYIINQLMKENVTLILMNIPDASKLQVANVVEQQVNEELNQYAAEYGVQVTVPIKTLTREILAQYNKIIQNMADEKGLKVIDMFNFMDAFEANMITEDQFHPNELGHKMIAEKVKEEIR